MYRPRASLILASLRVSCRLSTVWTLRTRPLLLTCKFLILDHGLSCRCVALWPIFEPLLCRNLIFSWVRPCVEVFEIASNGCSFPETGGIDINMRMSIRNSTFSASATITNHDTISPYFRNFGYSGTETYSTGCSARVGARGVESTKYTGYVPNDAYVSQFIFRVCWYSNILTLVRYLLRDASPQPERIMRKIPPVCE
jgi:hypothetical protein